jgi:hypothetical protein
MRNHDKQTLVQRFASCGLVYVGAVCFLVSVISLLPLPIKTMLG